MPRRTSKSASPVLATKHKDKRANIHTEEQRGFVADDEKAPKKILYSRDPQLVWKGKDEQDRQPLEVRAHVSLEPHPRTALAEDHGRRHSNGQNAVSDNTAPALMQSSIEPGGPGGSVA
jgi:adenine-specific DNA-methyltransferase